MSSDAPQEWFARIRDEIFGPVELSTLQHWASTGSMNGADAIGNSAEGPWTDAASVAALQMEWLILHPEGESFEPCHILSLRGELENGGVQPDWEILHIPSGETYRLVDVLCSALIAQNHILEKQLVANFTRIRDLERGGDSPGPAEAPAAASSPETWGENMRERDQFARQAAKWQQLYEESQERHLQAETEWEARHSELNDWYRKSSERVRALERRLEEFENMRALSSGTPGAEGDTDLRRAYQELRLQLDHLMESLDLRGRQLDIATSRLGEAEEDLRQERKRRAEELAREKDLNAEALAQLNRLEQAHRELTRAYRDLNERMIQLRNPMETPAPGVPAPAPAPPPHPSPAGSADARKKIKLT